ncbi:hypothetical protein Zm00014a_021444 [Zea mays]|uniref:Uncharacterized protein n=1 Tax=Zea mays TaxID=4577 RepID=A0A317Y876_MAIZE|nr:hypothetical protein Zm00014a_021444 [Zea mays]
MILFEGEVSAAKCLKDSLDQFSLNSGLQINYSVRKMDPQTICLNDFGV